MTASGRGHRRRHPAARSGIIVPAVALALLLAAGLALRCGGGDGVDLVLYSPEKEDYVDELVARFAEESGLSVRYDHLGSTGTVFGRLRAEAAHPRADIVYGGGGPAPFIDAAAAGLLAAHVPRGWEGRPVLRGNLQVRDADWRWFGVEVFVLGFAYNEDLVAEADVPRAWDALADERWRGRVMMPSPAASGTATLALLALLFDRGGASVPLDERHPGWAYFDRLYPIVVSFTDSGYGPTQAVAKGEVPLGVGFSFMARTLRAEQKARIGFVVPERTPVVVNPAAMVAGAPHPEAARRFLDWLASSPAAAAVAERWFRAPLREGASFSDGLDLDAVAARAIPLDAAWLGAHYEEARRLFRERYP